MDCGPLDNALERRSGHGFGTVHVGYQVAQIFIDKFDESFAKFCHIDGAGFHDLNGVGFVNQGQQKVFERCKFMLTRVRKR